MKLFCQIFFQNDSIFARGVAPPEKPEPELFSEEPELCQTGPNTNPLQMIESGGSSSTAGHLVSPFSRAGTSSQEQFSCFCPKQYREAKATSLFANKSFLLHQNQMPSCCFSPPGDPPPLLHCKRKPRPNHSLPS